MSVLIGLLVIVILVLTIVRMVGGTTTTVTYRLEPQHGGRGPLSEKTPGEIKALMDTMPTEWVTYAGTTPPLRLHLRGQTYDGVGYAARQMIAEVGGQAMFDAMPVDQARNVLAALNPRLIATAYVIDWEGAIYPNGAPMPFTISNVATRLEDDPYLLTFVTDEAHRLSPDWKNGQPLGLA